MTALEALQDIEDRLASPMVTYKENATEDAPRLAAALQAVIDLHDHPSSTWSLPCPELVAIETALRGES